MDTWATSSLSPQIAGGWLEDPDLFARVFPMDVRPQAHDIIRTWLFSTVLRSHLEFGALPWAHAAISGWVLDPDRKKMSKSKGNVVTPMGLLEEHGADGVRYWAASARPGTDTAFDPAQMKVGRRLSIKLLNAVEVRARRSRAAAAGDRRIRSTSGFADASLAVLVREATERLESDYDYAWVLQHTETFFWDFCDNYLELVKSRRYGDFGEAAAGSANAAMLVALSRAAAAAGAVPAVCDRRSVVVVAGRQRPRGGLADRSGSAGRRRREEADGATRCTLDQRTDRCSRRSARRSRSAACRPAPSSSA